MDNPLTLTARFFFACALLWLSAQGECQLCHSSCRTCSSSLKDDCSSCFSGEQMRDIQQLQTVGREMVGPVCAASLCIAEVYRRSLQKALMSESMTHSKWEAAMLLFIKRCWFVLKGRLFGHLHLAEGVGFRRLPNFVLCVFHCVIDPMRLKKKLHFNKGKLAFFSYPNRYIGKILRLWLHCSGARKKVIITTTPPTTTIKQTNSIVSNWFHPSPMSCASSLRSLLNRQELLQHALSTQLLR